MGGRSLGDRQDQIIGRQRKASEIKKKQAIGASPRAGTSTPGRQQLVARTLQQVEGSLTTGGYSMGVGVYEKDKTELSADFTMVGL
jgi:hypothetical protein